MMTDNELRKVSKRELARMLNEAMADKAAANGRANQSETTARRAEERAKAAEREAAKVDKLKTAIDTGLQLLAPEAEHAGRELVDRFTMEDVATSPVEGVSQIGRLLRHLKEIANG